MESPSDERLPPSQSFPACDACHSRKVRCDRNNPCGNCQDQRTSCTRHRSRRRLPRRATPRTERTSSANQSSQAPVTIQPRPESRFLSHELDPFRHDSFFLNDCLSRILDSNPLFEMPEQGSHERSNMTHELHSWISLVPLTDAQLTSQRQLECTKGLACTRRQALETALYAASQLPQSIGGFGNLLEDEGPGEEQRSVPSVEFLTWMLNDIRGDRFGLFVLDYFKHVSKSTLKHMGLSLLAKSASPYESILYTVCVNAMAYKFLTTVLMTDEQDELSRKLWQSALQCRKTAQRALKEIGLLAAPSLALLQAILCGIFLYQGSGDTQFCCELIRAACRVCVDLGLNTTVVNLQGTSEEEYYCVLWCYMLDRNYAWKLGRSQCFLDVDPGTILRHSLFDDSPVSSLLLIYIHLAQVQEGLIPFLKNIPSSGKNEDVAPSFNNVREQSLLKMEDVRRRINQIPINSHSHEWKGLDAGSEIAALDFAYHSVMTAIFHLTQVTPGLILGAGELYLHSARQGLSALVSICLLSSDKQATVAFLHWTLLYCPLTACFVLLCNAVTTSHLGDFNLLKTVTNCLIQSGTLSQPIATLQRLFQNFVSLSQCFFNEGSSTTSVDEGTLQMPPSHQLGFVSHLSQMSPFSMDDPVAPRQGTLLGEDHIFDSSLYHIPPHWDLGSLLGDAADIPPFSAG